MTGAVVGTGATSRFSMSPVHGSEVALSTDVPAELLQAVPVTAATAEAYDDEYSAAIAGRVLQDFQDAIRRGIPAEIPAAPAEDAADALSAAVCHAHTMHTLVRMAGVRGSRRGRLR